MKMIFSALLLMLASNSIEASTPKASDKAKAAEDQYEKCEQSCDVNCFRSYIRTPGSDYGQVLDKPMVDQTCVVWYQNCIKKCLFDYKHARNSQSQTTKK